MGSMTVLEYIKLRRAELEEELEVLAKDEAALLRGREPVSEPKAKAAKPKPENRPNSDEMVLQAVGSAPYRYWSKAEILDYIKMAVPGFPLNVASAGITRSVKAGRLVLDDEGYRLAQEAKDRDRGADFGYREEAAC